MLTPCCRLPDLFQVEQYTVTVLILCYNLILTAEHICREIVRISKCVFLLSYCTKRSLRLLCSVPYLSKMRCVVSLPKKFLERCHVYKIFVFLASICTRYGLRMVCCSLMEKSCRIWSTAWICGVDGYC